MTRSRTVLVASFGAVALTVAAAGALLLSGPARAAVGPLPAEALMLPADVHVVVGLDMQRLVRSPMYGRVKQDQGHGDFLRALREDVGVDPETDIDQVILAGGTASAAGGQAGLALVFGRFDRARLAGHVEKQKGVTWKQVGGRTLYLLGETSRRPGALTFLGDGLLAVGGRDELERMLGERGRRTTLRDNAQIMALLGEVKSGADLWLVADQTAVAKLPKAASLPGGAGASANLPPLRSLVVSAELQNGISLDLTGEASDEAAARNLADVVRGFVALASLQGQRPELKELSSAVNVTAEATRVRVALNLPLELIDSLSKGKGQTAGVAPVTAAPSK